MGTQFFVVKHLDPAREEIQISSQTIKEEFKATIKSQVPISGEKMKLRDNKLKRQ